jgi:hypothetical protein
MTEQAEGVEPVAKEAPKDEPAAPEVDGETESDADDLAKGAGQYQQYSRNINNFFDSVDARNSSFGFTMSARRVTGFTDPGELTRLLGAFVRPDGFDEALDRMKEDRLVILSGVEGIGKRSSALAILRAAAGPKAPVISLPPSWSLAELAEYPHFKGGRGYLVQDWVAPIDHGPLGFDIDVLRRRLCSKGTYLVITAGTSAARARSLTAVAHSWVAPDPIKVFDARTKAAGNRMSNVDVSVIRERIKTIQHPADIVAVQEKLGQGAVVALEVLGDADRGRVEQWFERKRAPRELLSLVALCFLEETPEPLFQTHLARLVDAAGARNARPDDTGTPGGGPPGEMPLIPRHQPRPDEALDEVERQDGVSDRRRVFRSRRYRVLVLGELVEKYGFELWQPVQTWLRDLVVQPPSLTQVRVALGLALYARHSPMEVQEVYLETWANGSLSERLTAAYLLSWMCIDDTSAATALSRAVSWTTDAGPRRAATAAMAFGGELGIRYQTEALSWLWYLTLRNEMVSRIARDSISSLLVSAADDPAGAATVLGYLNTALRDLVEHGRGRPDHGRFSAQCRRATSAVLQALSARPAESSESITAVLLYKFPNTADLLGQLWAAVLQSWPHRSSAITELSAVLTVMRGDEAVATVGVLGESVRRNLFGEENRLLRRDVEKYLSGSDAPKGLVTALLNALENKEYRDRAQRGSEDQK